MGRPISLLQRATVAALIAGCMQGGSASAAQQRNSAPVPASTPPPQQTSANQPIFTKDTGLAIPEEASAVVFPSRILIIIKKDGLTTADVAACTAKSGRVIQQLREFYCSIPSPNGKHPKH